MRLPLVFRWQLELSEQRRIADREQQAHTIRVIAEQRDREKEIAQEWRSVAEQARKDLMELQAKYHELATNPPTGIMKGPTLIDPFEGFPEKTKAMLRTQTAGRSREVVDTIVKRARMIQTANPNIDDAVFAERIRRGDYSG